MVQINFAHKQINAKVVYYGPGMSGKTTNLEIVHQRAPSDNRGDLTSISTDGDRTLFFDYMPLDLGSIAGMKTSFQMYTVPGQVYYNSTRKLVLQGVDGVIFIADSSPDSMEANIEALRNLEENLNEYGKSLATLPHVIQFNKRDLPEAVSMEEMQKALNPHEAPVFEAVAATGQGVFPTLKGLAALVLRNIQAECASGSSLARTGFHRAPGTPGAQAQPAAQPAAGVSQPAAATPRAPLSMEEPEPATAAAASLDLAARSAEAPAPVGAAPAQPAPAQAPLAPQGAIAPQGAVAPAPAQPAAAPAPQAPAQPARRSGGGVNPAGRTPGKPAMGSTQIMRRSQALGNGAAPGAGRQAAAGGGASRSQSAARRSHSVPAETVETGGGGTKTILVIGAAAAIGAVAAFFLLKFL